MVLSALLVAAAASLFYDYILTIDDEIRLVWLRRWTIVKVFFFLNRLFALALVLGDMLFLFGTFSESSCNTLVFIIGCLNPALFFIGEFMLFMRVYAIWGFDKRVLVSLAALLIIGFAGFIYVTIWTSSGAKAFISPMPTGQACYIDDIKSTFWIGYAILLVHEAAMLFFVVLKAFLATRNEAGQIISSGYRLVVKDGIGYFLCIFLLSVVNILTAILAPLLQRSVFITMHGGLQSILCARLLLRLRGAYCELEDVTTTSTWSSRLPYSDSQQPHAIVLHAQTTDEIISLDELARSP